MPKYSDQLVDNSGYRRPVAGATVYLLNADGTQATTTSPNPVISDDFGAFSFIATDGVYNYDARIGGVSIAKGNTIIGTPPQYVGQQGATGPANSSYATLAAMKAAPNTNLSYILASQTGPITYAYVTGDFTGKADDVNVVKLNSVPLTTGALVIQVASAINFDGRNVNTKLLENASVRDARFAGGAKGDGTTDDSAAFLAAFAAANNVYVPPGTYMLNNVLVPSNTRVYGSGANSILRPVASGVRSALNANSGSATATIDNVSFTDLAFRGWVDTNAFLEQAHLLCLNGVRGAIVERCRFIGFQGDGLYIGSGDVGGEERHNTNVAVRNCFFDGLNRDNRNGISVIDGVDVSITLCRFIRCSRPNMPGPIDFEPDSNTFHKYSDLIVSYCTFDQCGGNLGQIGLFFPGAVPLPVRVSFVGNKFSNYVGTGADIAIDMNRDMSAVTASMDVMIDGNQGSNGVRPFDIYAAKGITVLETNTFQDYTGQCIVGFNDVTEMARDVVFNPVLRRTANAMDRGILVGRVNGLVLGPLLDNVSTDTASSFPVQFSNVSSTNVRIDGLRIKPRPTQTVAINNAGHTFDKASNRFVNNDLGGLISQFDSTSTGPATLPLSGGWTDSGTTKAYRSIAGFGTIVVNIASGTLTPGTQVATTPVGYRPATATAQVFSSGTGYVVLRFDPDGPVYITPSAAPSASIVGSITYPLGS